MYLSLLWASSAQAFFSSILSRGGGGGPLLKLFLTFCRGIYVLVRHFQNSFLTCFSRKAGGLEGQHLIFLGGSMYILDRHQ